MRVTSHKHGCFPHRMRSVPGRRLWGQCKTRKKATKTCNNGPRQEQALRIAVALVPLCLDDVIPRRTLRTTTLVFYYMFDVQRFKRKTLLSLTSQARDTDNSPPRRSFKKIAWLPPRSAAEDATLSCQRGGLVRYRNLQPVPLPLRNSDKCPTCIRQTERRQRNTTPSGTSTGTRCCEGRDAVMHCHAGTQGRAEFKVHGIPGLLLLCCTVVCAPKTERVNIDKHVPG